MSDCGEHNSTYSLLHYDLSSAVVEVSEQQLIEARKAREKFKKEHDMTFSQLSVFDMEKE